MVEDSSIVRVHKYNKMFIKKYKIDVGTIIDVEHKGFNNSKFVTTMTVTSIHPSYGWICTRDIKINYSSGSQINIPDIVSVNDIEVLKEDRVEW